VARSINRFLAAADVSEDFRGANIAANGTTLHVRVGGYGPAVVLLHGFGDTGDMWARSPRRLKSITPSSFRTSEAWVSQRIQPRLPPPLWHQLSD
jgi:pimeloyl-ACP methyl ester carboxylesterase